MPITVTCPSCGWKKSFADDKEGKKTTCPECDEPITIRAKRQADRDDEGYEVVDDEKPKKRRRRSEDDEDDDSERPRARRRDDDDEDDEERPRRKKRRSGDEDEREGGKHDPTVKVVSGIATVVLIIGIIILRLWLRGRL
jgi:hypothetical protein